MKNDMKKEFNWRIFTSLGLFLSFLILFVSGVVLYVFPLISGSSAAGGFAGMTRKTWLNQHLVFGAVFAMFATYHLFVINREAFLSYIRKTTRDGIRRPAELLATILLTVLVAFGTVRVSGESGAVRQPGWHKQDLPVDDDQETAFYEHRRHHHDYDDGDVNRPYSQSLADRGDDTDGRYGSVPEVGRSFNGSSSGYGQAPDDDLHRRTTASCSSCH